MGGSGAITRPIADTSVPEFAEIRRHGRGKDWAVDDFETEEDFVTRWRALGVLGALTLGEGLYFAFVAEGGASFLALGLIAFVVAMLVSAYGGGEYGWAGVGAGLLAGLIAGASYHDAVFGTWPPAKFSSGVLPANGAAGIELGLMVGGLTLLVAGFVRAVQLSKRLSAE